MNYYAIHKGLKTGVFPTWDEAKCHVVGVKGAKYKKFNTKEKADIFVLTGNENATVLPPIISQADGSVVCHVTTSKEVDCPNYFDHLDKLELETKKNDRKRKREDDDVSCIEKESEDLGLPIKNNAVVVAKKIGRGDAAKERKRKEYERLDALEESIVLQGTTSYVRVFTDGSCLDLGKPTCRAGYGLWWNSDDDSKNTSMRLRDAPFTNNRAELSGILLALQIYDLDIPKKTLNGSLQSLWIKTDSMYSINCITKWVKGWKRNGWIKTDGSQVENVDLLIQIDKLILRYPHIKITYVCAHSGVEGNERADGLALLGCNSK